MSKNILTRVGFELGTSGGHYKGLDHCTTDVKNVAVHRAKYSRKQKVLHSWISAVVLAWTVTVWSCVPSKRCDHGHARMKLFAHHCTPRGPLGTLWTRTGVAASDLQIGIPSKIIRCRRCRFAHFSSKKAFCTWQRVGNAKWPRAGTTWWPKCCWSAPMELKWPHLHSLQRII